MRLEFLCILILLPIAALHAQYTSQPDGTFSLAEIEGCAPFTITLNAPGCTGDPACAANFEGSWSAVDPNNPASFVHTFSNPGTYNVRLLRGTETDNLTVTVIENIQPQFQVGNCTGSRVSIDVLDTNYDQYIIEYDDGSADDVTSSFINVQHQYASPGSKVISVRGRNNNAADNCAALSQTVIVVNAITAPVITTAMVTNTTSVLLNFNTSSDIIYKLEVIAPSSAVFQQIASFVNLNTYTPQNLRTEDNYYGFRLGAFNPCDNSIVYSPTVYTTDLELAVQNNQIDLNWQTNVTGTSSVTVESVNTTAGSTLTRTLTNQQIADQAYPDVEVVCGNEYCYRLVLNYANGSRGYSQEKCGTAISTDGPLAVSEIASIINDDGVQLVWQQPSGFTPELFSVFRVADGNTLLDTTRAYTIDDTDYTKESGYCYRIRYVDACNNQSPFGVEACPMVLTGSLTDENTISLTWSEYTGYTGGVATYVVEKYSSDGTLLETINTDNTMYVDETQDPNEQQYLYIVRAVPNNPGESSVSNRVLIIKEPRLFYPTAFTPNGDSHNDVFTVTGEYINAFEMDIFNRWGELMYTSYQMDDSWDGTFKNSPMPEGTYTFVARITDLAGRNFKRSGSVLLLRKKS